jgi:hypothetical protein
MLRRLRTKAGDLTLGACFVEMMFALEIGMKLHIELSINDVKVSPDGICRDALPQPWQWYSVHQAGC